MAGTKAGAEKASKTRAERYTKEQFQQWGREGGKKRVPKGFSYMDKEKLSKVGSIGGTKRWSDVRKVIKEEL